MIHRQNYTYFIRNCQHVYNTVIDNFNRTLKHAPIMSVFYERNNFYSTVYSVFYSIIFSKTARCIDRKSLVVILQQRNLLTAM